MLNKLMNRQILGTRVLRMGSLVFNNTAATTTKKGTTSFVMKKKTQNLDKKGVTKEMVQPLEWGMDKSTTALLPELSNDNWVERNLNTVFTIPPSTLNKLTQLPSKLQKEYDFLGSIGILLQSSHLQLNTKLEAKDGLPVLINGCEGSGKSVHLLQLVIQALHHNHIVIYSPNSIDMVNGTTPYLKPNNSEVYVQPQLTVEFLEFVRNLNKDLLEQIKINNDVSLGKTKVESGSSLLQLIEQALPNPEFGCQILPLVFQTLASQKQFPVLVAIDQVNHLLGTSAYFSKDSKALAPNQLQLPKLLLDLFQIKTKLTNGSVIAATSWIDTKYADKHTFDSKTATKPGFSTIPTASGAIYQYVPQSLTYLEAEGLAKYYNEASVLYKDVDEILINYKLMMSGGNPRKFFKNCTQGV